MGQLSKLRAGLLPAQLAGCQPAAGYNPAPHSGKPQIMLTIPRGRGRRINNPPQDTILPHTDVYFSAGPRKCRGTMAAKPSTIFTGLETSLT